MALDIVIALAAAAAQVTASFLGLIATTRPPAQGRHKLLLECMFVLMALFGLAALGVSTWRNSTAQAKADQAQIRIERLERKNGDVLGAIDKNLSKLSQAPPSALQQASSHRRRRLPPGSKSPDLGFAWQALDSITPEEAQRRGLFIGQLRALWIASHDSISSGMASGLEWPPENWLNGELQRYGQNWRVKVQGRNIQTYAVQTNSKPVATKPLIFGQGAFGEGTFGESEKR